MYNLAWADARSAWDKLGTALFFAWGDLRARYRRSVLGPWWLVLGTAIGVGGLGLVWGILLKIDREVFIPSLTVGLVVWQLISGCITDGSGVLIRNAMVIRNLKIPFMFYTMQLVLRQLINFAHNLVVVGLVLVIFPPPIGFQQLLLLPGLFLVIGNLLWMVALLGMVGARFRDIEPLVGAMMPILFFISPVIYRPSNLGFDQRLAWVNPFSYLITLIRDPIQGLVPQNFIYGGALLMLVVGWLVTLWLLDRKYRRIPFWI